MSASAAAVPVPQTVLQEPAGDDLLAEIKTFRDDCVGRYKFNNAWDTVLTTGGILLSIAVVAAGFFRRPEISAILGAVVGAAVTAQKAFPFGSRASFYRLLIGQADNLSTHARQKIWTKQQAVSMLSTLRLDFAQELPRGTSAGQDATGETKVAKGPASTGSAKGVADGTPSAPSPIPPDPPTPPDPSTPSDSPVPPDSSLPQDPSPTPDVLPGRPGL